MPVRHQHPVLNSGHQPTSQAGGNLPPNSDNQLKVYRDESFTNTIHHEASGQDISAPPDRADYGQWELSPGMKEEVRLVFKGIFGKEAADWKLHNYRICW